MKRGLLHDLERWEYGEMSLDELSERHPGSDVDELSETHVWMSLLASAPSGQPGPAWKVLEAHLLDHAEIPEPEQYMPDRRPAHRLSRRQVAVGVVAGLLLSPAPALAARSEVVRDLAREMGSRVGQVVTFDFSSGAGDAELPVDFQPASSLQAPERGGADTEAGTSADAPVSSAPPGSSMESAEVCDTNCDVAAPAQPGSSIPDPTTTTTVAPPVVKLPAPAPDQSGPDEVAAPAPSPAPVEPVTTPAPDLSSGAVVVAALTPGHGATPPGLGGEPPGQVKKLLDTWVPPGQAKQADAADGSASPATASGSAKGGPPSWAGPKKGKP